MVSSLKGSITLSFLSKKQGKSHPKLQKMMKKAWHLLIETIVFDRNKQLQEISDIKILYS